MNRHTHRIRRLVFDVRATGTERDGKSAQEVVSARWGESFSRVLEEVFDGLDLGEQTIRLERFEIDLGSLPHVDQVDALLLRLSLLLPGALVDAIEPLGRTLGTVEGGRELDREERRAELIRCILLTGTLPWWAGRLSLAELRREVRHWISRAGARELRWLDDALDERPEVAKRLASQLDPETFEIVLDRMSGDLPSPNSLVARLGVLADSVRYTLRLRRGDGTTGGDAHREVLEWCRRRAEDGTLRQAPVLVLERLLGDLAPLSVIDATLFREVLVTVFRLDAAEIDRILRAVRAHEWRRAPREGGEERPRGEGDEPVPRRDGGGPAPAHPESERHDQRALGHADTPDVSLSPTRADRREKTSESPTAAEGAGRPPADRLGDERAPEAARFDRADGTSPRAHRRHPPRDALEAGQPLGADLDATDGGPLYVDNAGLVLLSPFIPRLFEETGLTRGDRFEAAPARSRGALLLHYLVSGETASPEFDLVLEKVLCGIPLGTPLAAEWSPTPRERDECEDLLSSAIEHWSILKKTSIGAFRETFLLREGSLERTATGFHLRVARRGVDVLVDRVPWIFNRVSFPWMEATVHVEW